MANEQGVMLLGAQFSPFVHRVEMALKLKGIQYEFIEEDLNNKSPLLLESNPVYKNVPVLLHNGKPINESLIIIEYIDENWKHNHILPQDPYEKAKALFWAKFAEEKFTEVVRIIIATEGEKQEKEVQQAIEALQILEGELKEKKFFGGEAVGYVDIVLGWMPIWIDVIEEIACVKILDSKKFPHIAKWMQNLVESPAMKDNTRQRDMLVEYFEKIRPLLLVATAGQK